MRKLVLLGITTLLFGIDLPWLHNYEEGLQQAKKEKKDLYVFIGADKCRFCDMYKKDALSKKEVIDALKKRYILVYLSRDRDKIPKGFQKYGVPLHYFVKPNGKVYFIDAGTKNPDGVFLMLDEADLHR